MSWLEHLSSIFGIDYGKEEENCGPKRQTVEEELQEKICDARELLTFALSEGRAVGDDVIEAITRATDRCGWSPGAEAYIPFEKAYRDLARLLSPVTVEVLRERILREKRINQLACWVCSLLIAIAFLALSAFVFNAKGLTKVIIQQASCVLLGLLFLLFIFWAGYLFTDVVTRKIMSSIILFCYIFPRFFSSVPCYSLHSQIYHRG